MATSAIARRINKTRVLQTLLENPLMSRAEVARDLRLTKSTLSSVVGSLLADDLILERELEAASGRVGRPGIRIELNASSAHFLGAEISPDGIKITALDLTAKQVGLVTRKLTDPSSPGATLDQLSQMVGELARQLAPQSQTMGMGVALPGFVSTEGVLVHAPRLGWNDFPASRYLQERSSWPVHVDNDANLWAFGEWYLNRSLRNRQVALVSVSGGVGCGVVSEGRIIRGAHGLAGEMGHIVLGAGDGARTGPGRVTWDRTADKDTLLDDYRRLAGTRASLKQLIAAQQAGEPAALEVATSWSRWMAYGLLSVIYAYDPDVIIVAGDMADFFEVCKERVQEHLATALISGYPRARIAPSILGPGGSAIGAAAYMHRSMFDSTRIADTSP